MRCRLRQCIFYFTSLAYITIITVEYGQGCDSMLEGIGKISEYAILQGMKKKMTVKVPQVAPAEPGTTFCSLNSSGDGNEKRMLAVNKLNTGRQLLPSELDYLQQREPELYEKAVRISQRRQDFEQQLKQCRTKNQAAQVRLAAVYMTSFSAADKGEGLSAAGSLPENMMLGKAFEQSWQKFSASRAYASLAVDETDKKNPRKR